MATDTLEKVKKIIVDQLGVDESEVVPSASFVEDLNADSLDLVELIMSLEEAFGTEISDEEAENEEEKRIRRLYKKSGVYENDGSREMVWPLDGYIYDSTAVIYFDHESLVVAGDPHDNDVALVFFKHGKEIKSYKVAELTDDSRYLSKLDGSYDAAVYAMSESWLRSARIKGRLLIIENREGDTLTFEISTGEKLFAE